MVGMLLIFLVFVLLAAARSTELGMAKEDLWTECENNHEGMLGI